jgi:hypothetical protein
MQMKEIRETSSDTSKKVPEYEVLWSLSWQVRIAEITTGLVLSNTNSLAAAIVGFVLFVHGVAGPEGYKCLRGDRNHS